MGRALGISLILAFSLLAAPAKAVFHCPGLLLDQPGRGLLLGIVVGGRASGNYLSTTAKALGYHTVHIYPAGLPQSVLDSFHPEEYDFPPIVYEGAADYRKVAAQVQQIAASNGLEVGGFTPGMDYGVTAADMLSGYLKTPGNGRLLAAIRTDKGAMNTFLERRLIPVVKSVTVSPREAFARADEYDYPVFVKPASGWASIGAGAAMDPDGLRLSLRKLQNGAGRMGLSTEEVLIQDLLCGDTVYFVDTVSARTDYGMRRMVTGIWIDKRGDDFPKEVWDLIYMLPPLEMLGGYERELAQNLLLANDQVLPAAEIEAGTMHLEFMSKNAVVRSYRDLVPTDLNHRLPGIRAPHLEARATGVDPYATEIISRTRPNLLWEMPQRYTEFREHVSMVFLRTKLHGKVSRKGMAWMESRKKPDALGAYISDIFVPKVGTPVSTTVDGSTMVGFVHVVGPTRQAIAALYEEIRKLEREGFFVDG